MRFRSQRPEHLNRITGHGQTVGPCSLCCLLMSVTPIIFHPNRMESEEDTSLQESEAVSVEWKRMDWRF
jgi:hypothetical protein